LDDFHSFTDRHTVEADIGRGAGEFDGAIPSTGAQLS
jgi:hypothetical protein